MKPEVFLREIQKALKDETRDQRQLLGQTSQTWSGPPTYGSTVDMNRGGDAVGESGPGGPTKAVQKWGFLNKGTRVRRALMSRDWVSKTAPGRLRSGGGRGRVVRISRRISRPGIKARNFTQQINDRRRKPFENRMRGAFGRGAQGLF